MKRAWVTLGMVVILAACAPPAAERTYLPLLVKGQPLIFGVQIEGDALLDRGIYHAGRSAVHLSLRWSDVEAEKGVYAWPADFDAMAASFRGKLLVLNLKNSPVWARSLPELECSAPTPESYRDYAAFVAAAIDRYHPYAVELWNEPDVQPESAVDGGHWFGCIGDGSVYAQMVELVYPAVKSVDPAVIVIAGALMLGETMHTFTENLLAGREPFDAISYHAYVTWPGKSYDYAFRKAEYLRQFSDKPLWITETSLLCRAECGAAFEAAQADYLRYVFTGAGEHGLSGVLWYSLANNGWAHSELVELDRRKPAWYAYCGLSGGCPSEAED